MGQKKAKKHHVSFGKGRLARAALPFNSWAVQAAKLMERSSDGIAEAEELNERYGAPTESR